jgi:hypothetical protein
VYTQDFELFAAISLSSPTSHALSTAQVGDNGYFVANTKFHGPIGVCHLSGKLVPQNPGISKVGLVAGKSMKIGAANANVFDANQHLASVWLGCGGIF